MYCSSCGKKIADDSQFCGHCGATLSGTAAGTGQAGQYPGPPGSQSFASPPPPAGVPPAGPGQYGQPPRKPVLPWVLGGIGVLAVVAIVLVLVFVVFGGDGPSDTSGPEQVVERFWKAMEERDADMFMETIEPSFRSEIKDALGDYYDMFFEAFFEVFPEDLEVEIRNMETEVDGDKARVAVVDGTMSYTDEYGDKVNEEASESDLAVVELERVGGEWYLSSDFMKEAGLDPSVFEQLRDLQDSEGSESSDSTGSDITPEDDSTVKVILPIDSKEEAFNALLTEAYIAQWYQESLYPFYTAEEQEDRYVLFLFEQPYGLEQTPFGWFGVDKETGEVYEITNE